jgi:hypothetical protein
LGKGIFNSKHNDNRTMRSLQLTVTLCVAVIMIFGLVAVPAAGQDTLNNALRKAVSILSTKLGTPIKVVDSYSYSTESYADTSLDCPQDGQSYTAGPISAFQFLITIKGITYDVRVSADTKYAVLCIKEQAPQEITLTTYRTAQFSVSYPDTWQVNSRETDFFFGTNPTPVCAQPGMTVTVFEQSDAKTPDALLDEYAKQNSNASGAQFVGNRESIGQSGRSAVYTSLCADGSVRQSRITIIVAYERVFRIWQFAPQNAFDEWKDEYLQMVKGFSPAAGNSTTGRPVTAINRIPLSWIAHIFVGNVYVGTLSDLPGTAITRDAASDHVYSNAVVSPKGDQVAYFDPATGTLFTAVTQGGGEPRKLTDGVYTAFSPAWKADGSEIAYLSSGDGKTFSIMAVKIDGSGSRKVADLTEFNATCSTNPTDPAERLYNATSGIGGNDNLLLWATNGTLYYSLGCDGVGVGQVNGDDSGAKLIDKSLRRAKLSPDGAALLGITGDAGANKLIRLSLSDGKLTELPTAAMPDQVAWSANGKSIFYSTATLKEAMVLDADDQKDRGQEVFGVWPFNAPINDVSLHSIDLTSGVDTKHYSTFAFGITDIAPAPDGSGALFTLIQDSSGFVQAFKNNVAAADLRRVAPTTLVYWLPLPTGVAQPIAVTLNPSWGPNNSAPEPTPTGDPKNKPNFGPAKPTETLEPGVVEVTPTP